MREQRGQASVEWIVLVIVAALAFGGALTSLQGVDGRSLGGALAHRLTCAVKGGCDDGDDELEREYGAADAELVRRHLQGLVFEPGERQLPVDWRNCRAVDCAQTADDRDLDAHRSESGQPLTVFTRVLRRGSRRYIQYWFYYPDSNTTWAGSDKIWKHSPVGRVNQLVRGSDRYPGFHEDDWEGATVRVEADGRAAVRVTSHGHWQWCKQRRCEGRWGPTTGWTRVSRGSHAGHVPTDGEPGTGSRERTATPDAVRLIPLEGIDKRRYRRLDPGISPPWEKDAYVNPESPGS
ncbi:MAG TPA: hypothetical protein VFQ14_06830 [Thermoleophilaceae bacterium]|nr:hypothetical protein [Thermoleophilaceae bacterium]